VKEVSTLSAQIAEQVLYLFHGKRRGFGATVFPTVDGGKGDAELGGELFLSEPGSVPEFTDQSGDVSLGIQSWAPFRKDRDLIESQFIMYEIV
jgi:hypothetical protein